MKLIHLDNELVPHVSASVNAAKSQVTGLLRFIVIVTAHTSQSINISIDKTVIKMGFFPPTGNLHVQMTKKKMAHSFTHEKYPPKKRGAFEEKRDLLCCLLTEGDFSL